MADDPEPGAGEDPPRDDDADDDEPGPSAADDAAGDGSEDGSADDGIGGDDTEEPADGGTEDPSESADESDRNPDDGSEETGADSEDSQVDPAVDDDAPDDAADEGATDGTDASDERAGDDDADDDERAGDDDADDDERASDGDADDGTAGDEDVTQHEYVEDASVDPLEDLPDPGGPRDDEPPGAEEGDLDAVDAEPSVAGVAEAGGVGTEPEAVSPVVEDEDEDFWGSGPASDEEMPLADHIEEMMRRLTVVFAVGGVVTLAVLGLGQAVEWIPSAVEIVHFLWNHNIPGAPELQDRRPRVYGPLELVLTKLKVAGLAGLLVGLPVFVYETYLFMRPGLYPHERRYYLAAVPTSLILGIIGMAFAHFVVLPAIFSYFTAYTQGTALVAYGLRETFNLILLLMGYMAIVFQIPLFIMLAIMMNLVTRIWLEEKRLIFWGTFLGLAFLVSPDPTGMAPIIIAATMVVLYEGTLALLRWTGN